MAEGRVSEAACKAPFQDAFALAVHKCSGKKLSNARMFHALVVVAVNLGLANHDLLCPRFRKLDTPVL